MSRKSKKADEGKEELESATPETSADESISSTQKTDAGSGSPADTEAGVQAGEEGKPSKYEVDDRGNVAQFYDVESGDIIATLDREAEVGGKRDQYTWDGGDDVTEWAKANGYADEIAEAIKAAESENKAAAEVIGATADRNQPFSDETQDKPTDSVDPAKSLRAADEIEGWVILGRNQQYIPHENEAEKQEAADRSRLKPLSEYSTVELLNAAEESLSRDKSEKVTAEVSEAQIHIRYALGVLGGNPA